MQIVQTLMAIGVLHDNFQCSLKMKSRQHQSCAIELGKWPKCAGCEQDLCWKCSSAPIALLFVLNPFSRAHASTSPRQSSSLSVKVNCSFFQFVLSCSFTLKAFESAFYYGRMHSGTHCPHANSV